MAALTWPEHGPFFRSSISIRFAHCDPAGIIFFPQYLVLFNGLVEDWFNLALEHPYAQMLGHERTGLPIVHLECDFRAIARMGDAVHLDLAVQMLGSRSLELVLRCMGTDGVLRAMARKVLVFTNLDSHAAVAVPGPIRAVIERWMAGDGAQ